jgi:hypothetical protein
VNDHAAPTPAREVVPDVLEFLAGGAHADKARWNVLVVGMDAAPLHGRLDAAEARGVADGPCGATDAISRIAIGEFEAVDRAESG